MGISTNYSIKVAGRISVRISVQLKANLESSSLITESEGLTSRTGRPFQSYIHASMPAETRKAVVPLCRNQLVTLLQRLSIIFFLSFMQFAVSNLTMSSLISIDHYDPVTRPRGKLFAPFFFEAEDLMLASSIQQERIL